MPARLKILLITFGSRGDAHPFVAVGQALLREGCHAVVATSPDHRELVLSSGLDYVEVGPDAVEILRRLGLDMRMLARSLSGNDRFLFEKIIFPHLQEAYDWLHSKCEDYDVILSHPIAFSAHAVAEKIGIPLVLLTLSPVLLASAPDPPKGWDSPFIQETKNALGLGYNRLALRVAAELAWLWAAPLRRFRRELGLPPRGGFGFFAPPDPKLETIALFSPLLTTARPDPRQKILIAGHTFFDDPRAEDFGGARGVGAFLERGSPADRGHARELFRP